MHRHETVQMTPERAAEILKKNAPHNRLLRPKLVNAIRQDIEEGRWIPNHQPIGIDTDGNLIDGQHRLEAIRQSGATVEIDVTYEVKPAAFLVIDNGISRQICDRVDYDPDKVINSLVTSICVSLSKIFRVQSQTNRRTSNWTTDIVFERYGGAIKETLSFMSGFEGAQPQFAKGAQFRGLLCIYWFLNKEKAKDFITKAILGTNMGPDDPVLMLRDNLISHGRGQDRGNKNSFPKTCAAIAAHWNDRRSARVSTQDFPRIREWALERRYWVEANEARENESSGQ